MLNGDQQRISELETILLSLGSLTRESDGASLARKLVGGSVRKALILSYGLSCYLPFTRVTWLYLPEAEAGTCSYIVLIIKLNEIVRKKSVSVSVSYDNSNENTTRG